MPKGICRLCLEEQELKDSHYLPKSMYKYLREASLKNPNPIVVTKSAVVQVSDQLSDYLLCGVCEDLFNKNGEKWVLAHMARIGLFPIWDILHDSQPFIFNDDKAVYAGASIPKLEMDKLIYFGMSVFWRGGAHIWKDKLGHGQGIKLGMYEEPIRKFLLGKGPFPTDVALSILIWRTKEDVMVAAYHPIPGDTEEYDTFLFYVPGIEFLLSVGEKIPEVTRLSCSYATPNKIIYASNSVKRNTSGAFKRFLDGPDRLKHIGKTLEEVKIIKAKKSRPQP